MEVIQAIILLGIAAILVLILFHVKQESVRAEKRHAEIFALLVFDENKEKELKKIENVLIKAKGFEKEAAQRVVDFIQESQKK